MLHLYGVSRRLARKRDSLFHIAKGTFRNSCLLLIAVVAVTSLPAFAQLARFGPIDSTNGFPTWYQDTTGLTLDLCLPQSQAEMTWCLLPPIPNGVPPEVFPTNWAIENFYSDASAGGTQQGASMKLIIDLETSFANGFNVIPGDQVAFGRTRIKISPLPFSGTYTVYTPVGVFTFANQVAGDRIFFTEDIGLAAAGNFSAALNGRIGPFLLPSVTPGGAELPPMPDLQPGQDPFFDAIAAAGGATPYPNNGRRYIADPGRLGPITGGKTMIAGQSVYTVNDGTTRDPNIFRVEGPNGFVFETTQFSVMGRVYEGPIAGDFKVDRATYGRTSSNSPGGPSVNKVDVFATASPATQGRLPAGQPSATVAPQLSYFNAPCTATIDAQGNPGPPFSAPVGVSAVQMFNTGTTFFGESSPATIPSQVCVQSNAVNGAGQTISTFTPANIGDQITITQAQYDPNNQVLAISATSADQVVAQTLTVPGYGTVPAGGQLVVNPILAPAANVTVISTGGGSNSAQVTTGVVNAGAATLPVAVSDSASLFEDCSATPSNVPCATPVNINVLANDTRAVGGTITISSAPVLGTATVNPNGSIDYTPNLNAFGTDSFTYHVTVGTQTSNDATVSITITGVNDPPVAVNDTTGALRAVQNSVNVLANDTDPDGASDLAGVQIDANGSAELGIAPNAVFNGPVTFTPPSTTAAGTYTFSYYAVDKSGTLSANPATVTVTLATAEAILPAKAIYTQSKGRWTLSGTDSPIAGQTITMSYADGTYRVSGACTGSAAGLMIGAAPVDATGNFLYDQILANTAGVLNPSNTLGNSSGFWCTLPSTIIFSSSLSPATSSLAISRK
jgi:VCBS repeat-containing protein